MKTSGQRKLRGPDQGAEQQQVAGEITDQMADYQRNSCFLSHSMGLHLGDATGAQWGQKQCELMLH